MMRYRLTVYICLSIGLICLFLTVHIDSKPLALRVFVFSHCLLHQNQTDSSLPIKETAHYLLSNMSSNSGLSKTEYESLLDYFTSWQNTDKKASELIDSINHSLRILSSHPRSTISDIETVDKNELWLYLNDMNSVFNSPIATRYRKHTDLLDYVLPYRVANEPLNLQWRRQAEEFLKDCKDSVMADIDRSIPEIANTAMKYWNRKPFKWTDGLPHWGSLGVKGLWIKGGNCKDFGIGAAYLMKYFGIPSGIDFLFGRENDGSAHYWPFIIDEYGKTFFATQDIPYWNPAKKMDLPATKIYRQTFSIHSIADEINSDTDCIHPKFKDKHIIDVTAAYRNVYSITIDIPRKDAEHISIAYICNAARDVWTPVGIGTIDGGTVYFKDVAPSSNACIIAIMEGDEMTPLTRPFVIDETGNLNYFSPNGNTVEAHIYCKYPLSEQNGDVVDRMIGGRVEGADSKDFNDAEILYMVTSSPKRKINKVNVYPHKAYRYVRYVGADSTYCNIAELEIYENRQNQNIALGCMVFGTEGDRTGKGTHLFSNVFDGDLYSSFDYKYPSGGWSAVDLQKPRKITGIAYSPRNRDNYIRNGDVYELFYWNDADKSWSTLGKSVAETDELIYNIPDGTLLFLKNHSRGVNERVFEYDSKQDIQIFH